MFICDKEWGERKTKCGELTPLKDSFTGKFLYTGDLVDTIGYLDNGSSRSYGISPVMKGGNSFYIMGIRSIDVNTTDKWKVSRVSSWEELKPGTHLADWPSMFVADE